MRSIRIPPQLADAVDEDADPARLEWLAALPALVTEIASVWELELGNPYLPDGQCAWVAPARNPAGDELVLKLGWRHREAEHEAHGLRHWGADGAVRCFATRQLENTTALLLERSTPGRQLGKSRARARTGRDHREAAAPPVGASTPSRAPVLLAENDVQRVGRLARARPCQRQPRPGRGSRARAIETLRTLPESATTEVLLCTDLHAGNVLAARREPWLVIDPKPSIGDPAFDPIQHMLNCNARLVADPTDLAHRMAGLLDLDPQRVRLWLFARCAQESLHDLTMRELAPRLAP